MRTLIIGDIHGSNQALQTALTKAEFDANRDRLICIGDYVDGWGESFEVIEYLRKLWIKNPERHVFLRGNHDELFQRVITHSGELFWNQRLVENVYHEWWQQGGASTYESYLNRSPEELSAHLKFLQHLPYYFEENNILCVHAGFNPKVGFRMTLAQDKAELLWDRSLYRLAVKIDDPIFKFDGWDKIFIGHTPTTFEQGPHPRAFCNVVNLDQGCKIHGQLTCYEMIEE